MPPVHGPPVRTVGVVLEEHVVATVEVANAIRVVHPPSLGCHVHQRVPARVDISVGDGFIRLIQKFLMAFGVEVFVICVLG